jgi:hypothetical protein
LISRFYNQLFQGRYLENTCFSSFNIILYLFAKSGSSLRATMLRTISTARQENDSVHWLFIWREPSQGQRKVYIEDRSAKQDAHLSIALSSAYQLNVAHQSNALGMCGLCTSEFTPKWPCRYYRKTSINGSALSILKYIKLWFQHFMRKTALGRSNYSARTIYHVTMSRHMLILTQSSWRLVIDQHLMKLIAQHDIKARKYNRLYMCETNRLPERWSNSHINLTRSAPTDIKTAKRPSKKNDSIYYESSLGNSKTLVF